MTGSRRDRRRSVLPALLAALCALCAAALATSCAAGGSDGVGGGDPAGDGPGDFVCDVSHPEWTVGTLLCRPGAFEGYTLFAPSMSRTTYLIDMAGRLVHSWHADSGPGDAVYLEEGGALLRAESVGNPFFSGAGGTGGRVRLYDWDGAVLWNYNLSTKQALSHHDVERLPGGNVLVIAWEKKTADEAIAAGRDPARIEGGEVWSDAVFEIEPVGADGGRVVWEWHAWDHLVQDADDALPNFGAVSDYPGRVDVNYAPTGEADWLHTNAVDYSAELDQVVLSVRTFSELWVIDHGTTTAEAAGPGGDLLYRWGNPAAYGAGGADDRVFYYQHDAHWIDDGLAGVGHFLAFNNGSREEGRPFSTVEEIVPPWTDGGYELGPGPAYGPDAPVWTYVADEPTDLYSKNVGGAQRLPNGNTLIACGGFGTLWEVTPESELVWVYVSPVTAFGILDQYERAPAGEDSAANILFRATRIAPDDPALAGRDLTPGAVIEGPGGS